MMPDRILRVAALYHAVFGAVCVLLPGALLRSLDLEPPRHWVFYYGWATAPLLGGALLELARRREDLRRGLLLALILGLLLAMALGLFFVAWSGLPLTLLGPALASGLWAWLLWGIYSPERRPAGDAR